MIIETHIRKRWNIWYDRIRHGHGKLLIYRLIMNFSQSDKVMIIERHTAGGIGKLGA
jgi:hypothetical protein